MGTDEVEAAMEDAGGLTTRTLMLKKGRVGGKTLLDIGTGLMAIIAARDFNCRVTNIDISEEALRMAWEEVRIAGLEERIHLEKEDATNFSYQDSSFDVVSSYCALHHNPLDKREKFVREMFRVARERVIVSELTEKGFKQRHSFSNHIPVDLTWLEKQLNCSGRIEKHEGEMMNLYICEKRREVS